MISIVQHNPEANRKPYLLGQVEPPEHILEQARCRGTVCSFENTEYWQETMEQLYEEFRIEHPEPDADDEFLDFLEDAGWNVVRIVQVDIGK